MVDQISYVHLLGLLKKGPRWVGRVSRYGGDDDPSKDEFCVGDSEDEVRQ